MQFEELDNKIREAAGNHHPPYDENAWGRMVKLLDKYLPEEKDNRKRMIFFLLLFLALGGAGFWLFSNNIRTENKNLTKTKNTIHQQKADVPSSESANSDIAGKNNNKEKDAEISGTIVPANGNLQTIPPVPEPITVLLNPGNKNYRQKKSIAPNDFDSKKIFPDQAVQQLTKNTIPVNKDIINNNPVSNQVSAPTTNTTAFIPDQGDKKKDIAAEKKSDAITKDTKPVPNDLPAKDKESLVQHSTDKKTKAKTKKGNSFFFSLSAGPDFSFTGNDKLGKTKLLAGAGLGYTFKDRLAIRSGFYSGRKIYTSSPDSYHPPANFWSYYPNLEKVEADCRVYEIPLSLSYHFGRSAKQNWFASAGLSSYLMKKETYNYHYKYYAGGPTVQKKWTTQDENKHYFSVLTFSGGYQKNISKSFTIMAEPYIKIPLSGVGYGKVKLNSGGLLITIGFKPFAGSGNQAKIKD